MTTPVANTSSSTSTQQAGRAAAARQNDAAGNPFQQLLSAQIGGASANNAEATSNRTATQRKSSAETTDAQAAPPPASVAVGKSDETEPSEAVLSPELAAMIAGLLQRQAAGEAQDGDVDSTATKALLDKGLQQLEGDLHGRQASLLDPDDAALTGKALAASQLSQQVDDGNSTDLNLRAPLITADASVQEGASTEFSNVLQQLGQTAQTAQARAEQPATAQLPPRVGTQGWDQALGQRVVWMATGTEQSASLTLNPPELGPLQVVLNVSNNQANATFVAPHAEVRQALEAAMPKLREMLGDAGIQLGQASVSQDMPQQQGDFAGTRERGGRNAGSATGNAELSADSPPATRVTSAGNGLVDTFA